MKILRKKAAETAAPALPGIYDELAGKTNEVLSATSKLSDFDVQLHYVNEQLSAYTGKMQDVSEANLAVVEETTASMNLVNQTVNEAADNLKMVAGTASELADQNQANQELLKETVELKNEVATNSQTMSVNIEQLVTLSAEIDKVVASVQAIASQTNLLALNASIEAARAGEHGRGFAVVAEEVRQLAEDTKSNLESMRDYVQKVKEAAAHSKDSLQKTLDSTDAMGEKIEAVNTSVTAESAALKDVVQHLQKVDEEIRGITLATAEIDKAMDQTTTDAQKLSAMASQIKDNTKASAECAERVAQIDDSLSETTRQIYISLHNAGRTLPLDEFASVIERAKEAHKAWIEKLQSMVTSMTIIPLQTHGEKCAFGHFYRAVVIDNDKQTAFWKEIGDEHLRLHSMGSKVMDAVLNQDSAKANELCQETVKLSEQLLHKLDLAEQHALATYSAKA